MVFNPRGFFRFTYLWLSRVPWTGRRLLITVTFLVLYPALELFTWMGLLLDNLLFRGYRKQPIDSPVFIVGNFRSGTTFLHRLLCKDVSHFSTMEMWEVLFAPSIVQRKVFAGLAILDRWLGRPLHRLMRRTEAGWRDQNVMHEVALREPEEDDYLLLHIWSALTIGLSSGLLEEARPYAYFDSDLSAAQRRRIMEFYRRCVQRHLYARGAGRRVHYLAKNPALCPKLDSVLQRFPDAKIIYLARNPLEAIPSFLSMMQFSWRVAGVPPDDPALRDFILHMVGHWYRYPLQRLKQAPRDAYAVVNYGDLVGDPEQTIREVYNRLGLEVGPAFAQVLREETAKARRYRSRHAYSLWQAGLSPPRIVTQFRDVLERFGFDGEVPTDPEPPEEDGPETLRAETE
jgi:hypothetical protein